MQINMQFQFIHLNKGWNADPNAPMPEVDANGTKLQLRFPLSHLAYAAEPGEVGLLSFTNCSAWRLGPVNDEGWYRGQCRYTNIAPDWGEFYELVGEDSLRHQPNDWRRLTGNGDRHFLFYLRDDTFECFAADWSFKRGAAATDQKTRKFEAS